ncbi:MAG: hypothetical protein ACE5HE_07930 [Phycisphaerae bacterium]
MSLKTFHVVFVTLSTLLAAAFGVWAARDFMRSDQLSSLIVSTVSLLTAAALPFYGRWVLRKLRGVGWV